MIPRAHIQAWSVTTPWRELRQVEQDVIICRALCDIFREPFLAERLAFRGGTAIHKLLFRQPLRYSEDIDLVQRRAEPIGPTVNALRDVLSWLGPFQRDTAAHSVHLSFRFIPESEPTVRAKVKVEINTREHEYLLAAFEHYLGQDGTTISRANAEERMLGKLTRSLTEDIAPLLAPDVVYGEAEALAAFRRVWLELVVGLKGEPWNKSAAVIEEFRATSLPGLLRPTHA